MSDSFKQLKCTGEQGKQGIKKSGVTQTLSMSSSVTKVREYSVPGVNRAFHVSVNKSGRLWASDWCGNLVQTDQQENHLQKIQTSGTDQGYHTITQDGDLIYKDKKVIYRITPERKITEFIRTGGCTPRTVHYSRINGDIPVGMVILGNVGIVSIIMGLKSTGSARHIKKIEHLQRGNQGQNCICILATSQ